MTASAVIACLGISILVISSVETVRQYSWNSIEFSGDVKNVKENVFMAGIAYDTKTRFLCAGFPSLKYGSEVTIGCFDTDKYAKGSSPTFEPFPTRADNGLPVSFDQLYI